MAFFSPLLPAEHILTCTTDQISPWSLYRREIRPDRPQDEKSVAPHFHTQRDFHSPCLIDPLSNDPSQLYCPEAWLSSNKMQAFRRLNKSTFSSFRCLFSSIPTPASDLSLDILDGDSQGILDCMF